jgi:WD40 repeat protein
VLSPEWIKSNECRKELNYAVEMGKRLFPILYIPVDPKNVPPELGKINWVYMRDSDDFDKGFQTLCSAMDTDLDWIKTHTRIQVRALEWEKKKRDHSFVLRGNDLTEGEQFIAGAANKNPVPTMLQSEYILASRKDATRRQRQTLVGVTAALVISIALGVIAFFQRQEAVIQKQAAESAKETAIANEEEAKRQARISRVGELAAQSVSLREKNFLGSLLLGVEAFKSADGLFNSVRAESALLDNTQINPQLEQFLSGHTTAVTSVAFSPDGKTLASGSCIVVGIYGECGQGEIIFWNMKTFQPIGAPLHSAVYTLAFSPDGKTLASGSGDGSITLWDVESHHIIGQPMSGHAGWVNSVTFRPDGKMLASGGADGTVILWDPESRQTIGEPLIEDSEVSSVDFSPDGKILASGNGNGIILLWDIETHQRIRQPLSGHSKWVKSLAFSPDGKMLASGSNDNTIILWDVDTGKLVGSTLHGHTGVVSSVAFSPDGKKLASGSWDSTIILWDVETHQPIDSPLKGHSVGITSVAFSPDGATLASGGSDNAIILWGVKMRQPLRQTRREFTLSITSIAFSPDSRIIASGGCGGEWTTGLCYQKTILWDVESHRPISQLLSGQKGVVLSLAISPDSKTLASANGETILLWDMETRKPIGEPLSSAATIVAFSPNGEVLASNGGDNAIILWDLKTRKPMGEPLSGHKSWITSVAFSSDGKMLASGSCEISPTTLQCSQGEIILWNMATHQPIGQPFKGHSVGVNSVAFSPDGKTLASGSNDKTIILWNVETHQPIGRPLSGHTAAVISVAFNSNGNILASGSNDGTIILWDITTRQPIGQPMHGHPDSITSVAFSPNGNTLASGGSEGTLIQWDLNPESWALNACERVGRNFTRTEWAQYFPNEDYRKTCEQWPLEPEVTATPTAPP